MCSSDLLSLEELEAYARTLSATQTLHLTFVVLFNVLGLNLIIAMMGKTFANDMDDVHRLWLFPFANLVLHLERNLSKAQRRNCAAYRCGSDPDASAATAPVIELNMQGAVGAFKLASSIYRAHDLAYTQPDSNEAVASRQDWTEKCIADEDCATGAAGRSACTTRCPFPVANAYDHQDGTGVDVTTRIFLVDEDGTTKNTAVTGGADDVDFTKRSTYLFKYDAHDQAGNRAEQVVFALILDDQTAPTINVCNGVAETVEAASGWKLCPGSVAMDNIDGNVKSRMTYSIQDVTNAGASDRKSVV